MQQAKAARAMPRGRRGEGPGARPAEDPPGNAPQEP